MAAKRLDSNAIQIRLTDGELADLDEWVTAMHRTKAGSSGVSRASLVRDVIVGEIELRRNAITMSDRAFALVDSAPRMPFGERTRGEISNVIEGAKPILKWISVSRFTCSALASRLLNDFDYASNDVPPDMRSIVWGTETIRVLVTFMHEVESRFGLTEEQQKLSDMPF